jgi:hypothetical protein
LELGRDAGELGIQLGAEAIDDRDDRNGNPGSDQTVFNGSSAGLVLQKRNKLGRGFDSSRLPSPRKNRIYWPLKFHFLIGGVFKEIKAIIYIKGPRLMSARIAPEMKWATY